jgi:hypothetical protein
MEAFDDIPLNARSLSFRWDGYDYKLQLDPEHLTVEWKSPAYSSVNKTALRDLKPELAVQQWVSEGGRKSVRLGSACLVAALVVWFSNIRPHVPLLAPALLLFGVQYVYWFVRAVFPRNRTTVRTQNENVIVSIPHFERLAAQRRSFEESLLRMVKQARGDEHGS